MSDLMTKERFLNSLAGPTDDCPICYEPYSKPNDHVPVRATCGHWFGETCLREAIQWSPLRNNCPVCRAELYSGVAEASKNTLRRDLELLPGVEPDVPEASNNAFLGGLEIPPAIDAELATMSLRRMNDTDGAAFVQFLWRTIQPISVQHIVSAKNKKEGKAAFTSQEAAIISDLYERRQELDGDSLRLITLLQKCGKIPWSCEDNLFQPLYLSIFNYYRTELSVPEATILWKIVRSYILTGCCDKEFATPLAELVEPMMYGDDILTQGRYWVYHHYNSEHHIDGAIVSRIRGRTQPIPGSIRYVSQMEDVDQTTAALMEMTVDQAASREHRKEFQTMPTSFLTPIPSLGHLNVGQRYVGLARAYRDFFRKAFSTEEHQRALGI